MEKKIEEKDDNISLLDIVVILVKNKKFIIFFPLIAFMIIIILSILSLIMPADSVFNLMPNKYKPSVTVMLKIPGESQGGFSSLLNNSSNQIGSLVSLLGGNINIESADLSALIKVLINTNDIKDIIINEFDFAKRYKIRKLVKTTTRNLFSKRIAVEINNQSNVIKISYIDIDAIFATKVVNRVVEELEKKVKNLYLEKTYEKKTFLEERIKVKEFEFEKLQNKMINYQKKYGIINVSSQADKSISFIAELQTNIINRELELKAIEKNSPYDKTRIEYLQYELSITKKLIEELKSGGSEYSNEFIPLDKLPELAQEYVNLNKDLTIQGLILEMLKQQYEAVKIEESDKSQTFRVLEWAEIPEIKNSPRRTIVIAITVFAVLIISIIIVFIKEYYNKIKKDPVESEKINYVKNMIFGSKKNKTHLKE